MKDKQYYLCGIGHYQTENIDTYRVGIYEGNGWFSFPNADYGRNELGFHKTSNGNANCVLAIKSVDDIELENTLLI